jgi:hypothetical protein
MQTKQDYFIDRCPKKSLIQKGEKCKGGKLSKERLSVLFCCSATGEKLKPLVIVNAARPLVFKKQCTEPNICLLTGASTKEA